MYSRKLGITQDSFIDRVKQKNASEDFNNLIRTQYIEKMGEPKPAIKKEPQKSHSPVSRNTNAIEDYKNDLSDKIQNLSQTAKGGIEELAKNVDLDDIVIIALIVFLLCDKTENDIILLATLIFVLFN